MANPPWQPLSVRQDPDHEEPALFEGVPSHLDQPLRAWLSGFIVAEGLADQVGLRLRLTAGDFHTGTSVPAMAQILVHRLAAEALLDAIDAALHCHPAWRFADDPAAWLSPSEENQLWKLKLNVVRLDELLMNAGSAYQLTAGARGLERRVDTTVTAAASTTGDAAEAAGRPEAARDLAEAWAAVYGRHPRPSEAYRLAVRAVEGVAIPIVLPNATLGTLGKVLSHLREAAPKWELAMSPDIGPLISMITLLWKGQTDRHGGRVDLERVDQAGAEMAVHLATTLMQWFTAGHVRRLPHSTVE